MRFRGLTAKELEALRPRSYPGFPEYTLLDVPGTRPATFRRGASTDNLRIAEAEAWQEFIAGHYLPPENARVLLLHPCSWAKPYDFSATLEPVVEICRAFPFVHRLVFSNVGIIPAELQMNDVFCSYDWCPVDPDATPELGRELNRRFEERLREFVLTHNRQYAIVGIIGSRRSPKTAIASRCAAAAGLPFFSVPDDAGEKIAMDDAPKLRLFDDVVRHPEVLRQLRDILGEVERRLRRA